MVDGGTRTRVFRSTGKPHLALGGGGGGGGGGLAQLVVVPLAMGRGAKSPGFDSHRGLSFQKGREDGWIGLNPPPGVHGSSPSYASSGRLTV